MKTSRFSETQIITILKQGDGGIKVKDLCREHGLGRPPTTIGKPSMGGWRPRISNVSKRPSDNWPNSNACMPISP